MPVPGSHVHQQLISGYERTAAELERLRGQVGRIEQQRGELEQDRAATLGKLAEYYLPDLTSQSVQKTWTEIRPTMNEILLRKENRLRELNEDLDDQNRIRQHFEQELTRINERLDEAERRQTEVTREVETSLQTNPEFIELSKHASMAEVALERAEANFDEISQDAARKLPAYEDGKLFTYLRDRQYGTPKYRHRGLNKRMDRWIAGLANYTEAKHNYDYLTNTPTTMRTIIAEDRMALDTVMDELQRHRDDTATRYGLMAQVKAVEAIQAERKSTIEQLGTTSRQCETTQSELNRIEDPRCEFYSEAIDVFRQWLSRSKSEDLRREARRTPEITDDQIVASLRGIESDIDASKRSTTQGHDDLQTRQEVYEAIGRLVQRFRASGYDRGNCLFSEAVDVAGSLDRADESSDIEDLWQSLRRAQSWGPTTLDKITSVATHPMTQVLIGAMAHAAVGVMSEHARRAGGRSRRNRW